MAVTTLLNQMQPVSQTDRIDLTWCDQCQANVKMLSTDEAVAAMHLAPREIFRMIESARVHFTEDQTGQLLICPESLSQKEPPIQ